MNHSAHFRYGDEEQASIETIIERLRQQAPGTKPNVSDAIRYAVIIAAANIRTEEEMKKKDDANFKALVNAMDDELREQVHNDHAPCNEEEFIEAYRRAHLDQFGEEWEPTKDNPTW